MRSPIDIWLLGGPDRGVHAIVIDGQIAVTLIDPTGIAGMGEGETLEEATAAALNDVMARGGNGGPS